MLDTDIASYLIKGHSVKIEKRIAPLSASEICVSAITQAELSYGLKQLPSVSPRHLHVERFLKTVRVLPWGADAADIYAGIRHELTVAGRIIGQFDMMIAAHGIAAGAVLVTNNKRHFSRIGEALRMEYWSV